MLSISPGYGSQSIAIVPFLSGSSSLCSFLCSFYAFWLAFFFSPWPSPAIYWHQFSFSPALAPSCFSPMVYASPFILACPHSCCSTTWLSVTAASLASSFSPDLQVASGQWWCQCGDYHNVRLATKLSCSGLISLWVRRRSQTLINKMYHFMRHSGRQK